MTWRNMDWKSKLLRISIVLGVLLALPLAGGSDYIESTIIWAGGVVNGL